MTATFLYIVENIKKKEETGNKAAIGSGFLEEVELEMFPVSLVISKENKHIDLVLYGTVVPRFTNLIHAPRVLGI